jgi:hypothetical protein
MRTKPPSKPLPPLPPLPDDDEDTADSPVITLTKGLFLRLCPAGFNRQPGRSLIIPDYWQVDVELKPEELAPQTSHRAWPPKGLCT